MPRPGPRLPSASAPRPALRSRCAARGTAPVTTRRSPGPAAAGPAGQAGGAPLAVPAHVRRAGRRGGHPHGAQADPRNIQVPQLDVPHGDYPISFLRTRREIKRMLRVAPSAPTARGSTGYWETRTYVLAD